MTSPANVYKYKTEPYAHQRRTLEQSWSRKFHALLCEMGTGKSKILIDNICLLREVSAIDCVLIIAVKGTYANWFYKEIPAHMPDRHRETARIHLWRGGGSVSERDQISRLMSGQSLRVLIVNTEALSQSERAYDVCEQFVRSGRCMMVFDESSSGKNPQAKRTKKLIRLGRQSAFVRIATGSPVTKSPLDLWSQFEIGEPAALGYRSFVAFRSRFAITETKEFGGRKIDIVVGHRDTDLLEQLVQKKATVLLKKDCLDLPPKIYTTRDVELTTEQARVYGEVRQWCTSQLASGMFVTATQVITQLLRLHQIVCGHVTDEEGNVTDLPSRRLDALQDTIEESQGRVIVWCNYRRNVDRVMERLREMGLAAVRYDGGTSPAERRQAIYRFQGTDAVVENGRVVDTLVCPASERADVFVGTQSAGGYGITLTEGKNVVYFSNNYDYEKRLQSEDRAHRIGQTDSVTYVDLVARGTVDEKIAEALSRKETLANLIMDGPSRVRDLFS